MSIELFVSSTSFLQMVGQLENSVLSRLFINNSFTNVKLNQIYYGKIVEKSPQLACFFVEVISGTVCLLKFHKNNLSLTVGSKIFVQVVKEATLPKKMPVVSDDITFYGYFLNYKPLSNHNIISKNIALPEKQEILHLLQDRKGCVVRSSFKRKFIVHFKTELEKLFHLWENIQLTDKIGLVYEVDTLYYAILCNSKITIDSIFVDDRKLINYVKEILSHFAHLEIEVIFNHQENIFFDCGISDDIESLKENTLDVMEGIKLHFISNHAFTYIDVDYNDVLGNYSNKEEASFKINLQILSVIYKQIILRNYSGQILVDLLKMKNKQYNNNVIKKFQDMFASDINKTSVLGFSHLGILECSRQKTQDFLGVFLQSDAYKLFNLIVNLRYIYGKNVLAKVQVKINAKLLAMLQKDGAKDIENFPVEFIVDNVDIPKIIV
jgi:ribonuclease G